MQRRAVNHVRAEAAALSGFHCVPRGCFGGAACPDTAPALLVDLGFTFLNSNGESRFFSCEKTAPIKGAAALHHFYDFFFKSCYDFLFQTGYVGLGNAKQIRDLFLRFFLRAV